MIARNNLVKQLQTKMVSYRALKWTLLIFLLMTSRFLASFNATLRYIVDQCRELAEADHAWKDEDKEAERGGGTEGLGGCGDGGDHGEVDDWR